MSMEPQRPLRPGDPAPRFSLPAINREGLITLDDYRGKRPVLLGLFRGLPTGARIGALRSTIQTTSAPRSQEALRRTSP